MYQIELLKWDTCFFKFNVGRIEIDSINSLSEIQKVLDESFFRIVYIQIKNPTRDEIEQISRIAPLMDERVIFEKRVCNVPLSVSQRLEKYKGTMTSGLLELAWTSGTFSRFNLDANFRPYFKQLYQCWLERSIQGDLADALFVAYDGSLPVGFVTLASKDKMSGQIGLIAVSCDYRRKGIASLLLRNSEAWCHENECKVLQVTTQATNLSACRLYTKYGFNTKKKYGIFHYWNTSNV